MNRLRFCWLCVSLLISSFCFADIIPLELIDKARADYGDSAQARVKLWNDDMVPVASRTDRKKLESVNAFFNANLPYRGDFQHWGKEDYWATPYEALGSAGGDCEDYVIAKYFTLKQLGVSSKKMRITYVNAIEAKQAHMVLVYYPASHLEPLVLDNLNPNILPVTERTDLVPIYSFNVDGLWLETQDGDLKMGNADRLGAWSDLRKRMHKINLTL